VAEGEVFTQRGEVVVEGAVLRVTPEMPEIRLFQMVALVTPETLEVPVTQDRQATRQHQIVCQ
jgi:hypothetical protein